MAKMFPHLADEDQEITLNLLGDMATAMGMREDIPPRLIYRTLLWAQEKLIIRQDALVEIASRANSAATR